MSNQDNGFLNLKADERRKIAMATLMKELELYEHYIGKNANIYINSLKNIPGIEDRNMKCLAAALVYRQIFNGKIDPPLNTTIMKELVHHIRYSTKKSVKPNMHIDVKLASQIFTHIIYLDKVYPIV